MNTLTHIIQDPILFKLLLSGIFALFSLIVILIIRQFLHRRKIASKKRVYILKLSAVGLFVLYVIVLIRIWAGNDLLSKFKNDNVVNLIKSGMALGIVYLFLYFIRRFINSLQISITQKHRYRKRVGYIAIIIYLIILIPIWAGSTQQWATILSVMGAGIALALHEVLLNIAGWFYILIRHPFRTGDRIELADLRGDVIDINVMQTTLLEIGNWVDGDQSTGRVVHCPHGQIFRQPLYNYTQGFEFIWNELSVTITFESNWERAKDLMIRFGEEESKETQEIVRSRIDRMAREYLIYYRNFSPIVYIKIENSGVKLTLRHLTEAKNRRLGIDTISKKILKAYTKASDIEFAYPTYRIYRRGEEGMLPDEQNH